MSDILIKNMKMPESCAECRMLEGYLGDGICHANDMWLDNDFFLWNQFEDGEVDDSKPINCPLIEVPPHGDLIDINALKLAILDVDYVNKHNYLKGVLNAINNAPTVIPADKEAET